MGVLRLGFVANFLSHPVIAGFITASGILIATSQLKHILGVPAEGHTLPADIDVVLSGHIHLSQAIVFDEASGRVREFAVHRITSVLSDPAG